MGRPFQAVNAIINGRKTITADTALQLEDVFGASATYWMGLEAEYQIYRCKQMRLAKQAGQRRHRAVLSSRAGSYAPPGKATPKRRKPSPK
jgi:HTH-type transcriptional regulator / antitoxin HigA